MDYSATFANKKIVFIFQHFASSIKMEESFSDNVYKLEDKRLYDPKIVMDVDKFTDLFYENFDKVFKAGKIYVSLFFSPPLIYAIDLMRKAFNKSQTIEIIGIAFFHNDNDTSKYRIQDADGKQMNMSDWKKMTLDKMENYPFIKKFTVPVGFSLDNDYMNKLLTPVHYDWSGQGYNNTRLLMRSLSHVLNPFLYTTKNDRIYSLRALRPQSQQYRHVF